MRAALQIGVLVGASIAVSAGLFIAGLYGLTYAFGVTTKTFPVNCTPVLSDNPTQTSQQKSGVVYRWM
jgi:hypothetical protein